MRKLAICLLFATLPMAFACPKYDTIFNGSGAQIIGMNPYCTTSGRVLAADFRSSYEKAGATVHWVEGYRIGLSHLDDVIDSLSEIIDLSGYEYVDMAEGEYVTVFMFHKLGTTNGGLMVSVEPKDYDAILTLVEGRFPYMN